MSRYCLSQLKALFLVLVAGGGWTVGASARTVYPEVPVDYIACAMDRQTCQIRAGQTSDIYWGADGAFSKALDKSGSVSCTEAGLGIPDPISGTLKTCYIRLSAASGPGGTGTTMNAPPNQNEFPLCATEGKMCEVTGDWDGYYGGGSGYANIKGTGNFTCALANFHIVDPADGQAKQCYVSSAEPSPAGSTTKRTTLPDGFKACATDGKVCATAGPWTGWYGAGNPGTYVKISGPKDFVCLPNTFGIADPIPGTKKTCYIDNAAKMLPPATVYTSLPEGYKPCAEDGETCIVTGDWDGYYGVGTTYLRISGENSFTCLPGNLLVDDPKVGTRKTCYVNAGANLSRATATGITGTTIPPGFHECAKDFGKCSIEGYWTGWYGVHNNYKQITGYRDFICLPATFGIEDPAQGTQKACYTKVVPRDDTGTKCTYTAANRDRSSTAVSMIQCSCRCHANLSEPNTCRFGGNLIRSPVCKPGQYP